MTAHLNTNAAGIWATAEGTPVEPLARTANGRAVVVELLEEAAGYKAGKRVTLPLRWVDSEPEPEVCPTCGRPLEGQRSATEKAGVRSDLQSCEVTP